MYRCKFASTPSRSIHVIAQSTQPGHACKNRKQTTHVAQMVAVDEQSLHQPGDVTKIAVRKREMRKLKRRQRERGGEIEKVSAYRRARRLKTESDKAFAAAFRGLEWNVS
jgi:hypothetical protein